MNNKFIIPFMGLIMIANFTTAQQKHSFTKDTFFVADAGTRLNDIIPPKYQFHYSSFVIGKVFFRDGQVIDAKMNYNRLTDEMLFLSKTGDTLALDDEPTIKLICIDKDSFYYDKGYVLLVKAGNDIKLAMKQGFRKGDRKKETGYGMMSSTSSTSSISSLHNENRIYQLEVKEQTVIHNVTNYYFGDKYNRFVLATEKNLAELFPKCAESLNQFCKKNTIDFNRRDDLEMISSFLESKWLAK